MSNYIHNGNVYVKWSVMGVLLAVVAGLLGILWSEIKSVREAELMSREQIVEVRNDVKWIRALIELRGEITLKNGN